MSDRGLRVLGLNALCMILAGMFLGGVPLIMVVVQAAYHQAPMFNPGADYRGWMMAHLEGLFNGLLVIGVGAICRIGTMPPAREKILVPALLIGGWGNTVAAILAPVFGVRGMVFDGSVANNVVAGLFTVALLASVVALASAIRHLVSAPV